MLRNRVTWLLVLGLAAAGLLVSWGCSGSGGAGEPTPAPTPTPDARRTGIAGVDAVIDAVVSANPDALRPLIRYASVPCAAGVASYRACPPGQAAGSPIDALPATQCEKFFIGAGEVVPRLRDLMVPARRVYAVYPDPRAGGQGNAYVVVLTANVGGRDWGSSLTVEDGRVTAVDFGCRKTPEQIVETAGLRDPVLPPAPGSEPEQ